MAYFAIQQQVLFHDTMAYGTHHHSANIKFQNVAREILLFASDQGGDQPSWQEQLQDIILLTREAYSLNLGAANLGEKIAVLMTYEEPTRSSMRLCFRIVGSEGQQISCGYQTMVMVGKHPPHDLVPGPLLLSQYLDAGREGNLIEELAEPSFGERIHQIGGTRHIFNREICEIGKRIANAPRPEAYPKIVDLHFNEHPIGGATVTKEQVYV